MTSLTNDEDDEDFEEYQDDWFFEHFFDIREPSLSSGAERSIVIQPMDGWEKILPPEDWNGRVPYYIDRLREQGYPAFCNGSSGNNQYEAIVVFKNEG